MRPSFASRSSAKRGEIDVFRVRDRERMRSTTQLSRESKTVGKLPGEKDQLATYLNILLNPFSIATVIDGKVGLVGERRNPLLHTKCGQVF